MKIVVYTQVCENYGGYWKPKGGDEYIVARATSFETGPTLSETVRNLVAQFGIERNDEHYTEHVISWEILGDREPTEGERDQIYQYTKNRAPTPRAVVVEEKLFRSHDDPPPPPPHKLFGFEAAISISASQKNQAVETIFEMFGVGSHIQHQNRNLNYEIHSYFGISELIVSDKKFGRNRGNAPHPLGVEFIVTRNYAIRNHKPSEAAVKRLGRWAFYEDDHYNYYLLFKDQADAVMAKLLL
jgi:hypothetical protein